MIKIRIAIWALLCIFFLRCQHNNSKEIITTEVFANDSIEKNTLPTPTPETIDKFYTAINTNDIPTALSMIGTEFPGNYEPSNKVTPLQASIWRNNIEVVKKLVEHNANINTNDASAVEEASEYGTYEILEYLLQHNGNTDNAAFSKAKDYRCAKLLLVNGANQEKGGVSGKLKFYLEAVEKNDTSALNLLKLNSDELNYNNCDGETALILAIKNQRVPLITYLLNLGVDPEKPETFDCGDDISTGKTPLQLAMDTKNENSIEALRSAVKNK